MNGYRCWKKRPPSAAARRAMLDEIIREVHDVFRERRHSSLEMLTLKECKLWYANATAREQAS